MMNMIIVYDPVLSRAYDEINKIVTVININNLGLFNNKIKNMKKIIDLSKKLKNILNDVIKCSLLFVSRYFIFFFIFCEKLFFLTT